MYRKGSWKYLAAGVAAALVAFFIGTSAASDTGQWLLTEKRSELVKLTPVDRSDTGATGFELRLPSGNVVTVTNAHVCGIVGPEGKMMAHYDDGSGRKRPIRVLEISDKTDLCILEGLPGKAGLDIADSFNRRARIYVLGHPHLRGLTLSAGYPIEFTTILIQSEQPLDQCDGPKYQKHEEPGFLGVPETICVESISAYDSSAIIFPGNSGSPTMNSRGEVVGVMFAGDRRSNHGVFISLDDLKEFVSRY